MVWVMTEKHAEKYGLYFFMCYINKRFRTDIDLSEEIHRLLIDFLNTKIFWTFEQMTDPFFALFSINYYFELDFRACSIHLVLCSPYLNIFPVSLEILTCLLVLNYFISKMTALYFISSGKIPFVPETSFKGG